MELNIVLCVAGEEWRGGGEGGRRGRGERKRSHHKTDEYNRHLPQEVWEGTVGGGADNIASLYLDIPSSPPPLPLSLPLSSSRVQIQSPNLVFHWLTSTFSRS